MTSQLYWAYGSNLNVEQMRERCPDAKVFGPLNVPNAVLRFRGVADVTYLKGATCPGGLWEVSERDVAALDRYEGIDHKTPAKGLYSKKHLVAEVDGEKRKILYYQMNEVGIMPPSQWYLDVIAKGYRDFGLDLARLERALKHSWERRRKTPYLRWKWKRRGAPKLATTVGRVEIPFEIQDNEPDEATTSVTSSSTPNGMKRCQASHCWELIEDTSEICSFCGAWQTQGGAKRYGLRKGGKG